MYEFIVGQIRISCADDWDEEPISQASEIVLSEHLREGDTFTYLYDFGDGWEIQIHVVSTSSDYDQPQPESSLLHQFVFCASAGSFQNKNALFFESGKSTIGLRFTQIQ